MMEKLFDDPEMQRKHEKRIELAVKMVPMFPEFIDSVRKCDPYKQVELIWIITEKLWDCNTEVGWKAVFDAMYKEADRLIELEQDTPEPRYNGA